MCRTLRAPQDLHVVKLVSRIMGWSVDQNRHICGLVFVRAMSFVRGIRISSCACVRVSHLSCACSSGWPVIQKPAFVRADEHCQIPIAIGCFGSSPAWDRFPLWCMSHQCLVVILFLVGVKEKTKKT